MRVNCPELTKLTTLYIPISSRKRISVQYLSYYFLAQKYNNLLNLFFLCYYCSIKLKRQLEHSGLRPNTSSLVAPFVYNDIMNAFSLLLCYVSCSGFSKEWVFCCQKHRKMAILKQLTLNLYISKTYMNYVLLSFFHCMEQYDDFFQSATKSRLYNSYPNLLNLLIFVIANTLDNKLPSIKTRFKARKTELYDNDLNSKHLKH